MENILIITSYGPSLVNFRFSLIKKMLSKGHKVYVASPINNFSQQMQEKLICIGVKINIVELSSQSLNGFNDLKFIIQIYKIIKNYKPSKIISYTAKPVIYTGLILNFFKSIDYFPMITGLGYFFIERNSIKHKFFQFFIIKLYTLAIKNSTKIIFQNNDDRLLFLRFKIIQNKNILEVVNGSGVDLKEYPFSKLPLKPVFLMISRLLIDKGIREYVGAAKIVRSKFPNTSFQIAGYLDKNPSSISPSELDLWIKNGYIEYLGSIKSAQSALKACKFFVLPSYREGTPRSTLEALSSGRPIITTDTPGCRETVIHGKNGFLIQAKNSDALANAMIELLKKNELEVEKMGKESFHIAKTKYDVKKVNRSIMEIMNL